MKKTLFAALALVSMASCSNEEVLEVAQKEAIGFENAFVNNSTRSVYDPSYSSTQNEGQGMFNNFKVFGFVNGAALFAAEGETVTGPTTWTYTNTQYWINGANYNFHAVAPATGWTSTKATKDGVSLSFTNDGKRDVLYASAEATGKPTGQNSTVGLTFRHILSKVKFSFENAYNATNATIKVSDIHITNAHQTGSVALNAATTWSDLAGTLNLDFGDATQDNAEEDEATAYSNGTTLESYNECLLIPSAEYEYEVKFTVHLLISNAEIDTYSHTVKVKFAPLAGNSYDIKAIINPSNIDPENPEGQDPIVFTVTAINGWTTNPESEDILKE